MITFKCRILKVSTPTGTKTDCKVATYCPNERIAETSAYVCWSMQADDKLAWYLRCSAINISVEGEVKGGLSRSRLGVLENFFEFIIAFLDLLVIAGLFVYSKRSGTETGVNRETENTGEKKER